MAKPTRRHFLTAAAAAVAAVHTRPGRAEEPEVAMPSLEQALEIAYSEREWVQLAGSLEAQLALVRARRGFQPPYALAPASVFDPRLPGRTYGPQADALVWTEVIGPPPRKKTDLAYASVAQLSHWLRARQVRSEALAEIYLERLQKLDPTLRCVISLLPEQALAQARRADEELDAGTWRGPLHGVPWGAKDLLDTAGVKTTWGATPYQGRVAEVDAAVVRRLDEAGAVLLGKLTLGALAYGDIWFGGKTRNPWLATEGSSGSSAGSASAVAAGCVAFAIGTETLGSIVSPSTRCGITGLRPTFGRVSRAGAMPLCWSLDKIGPLARSVEDCVMVLDAIRGRDPADPSSIDMPLAYAPSEGLVGTRIGFDPMWFAEADPIEREVLDALRTLGAEVVEVATPPIGTDGLLLLLFAEAAAAHELLTKGDLDDQLLWQDDDAWPNTFRSARLISAVDLVQADRLRRQVMRDYGALFDSVDALISPSFGNPLLVATNFTGHPSLTLRVGFHERQRILWPPSEGTPEAKRYRMPLAMTLWGGLFDEGALCRIGAALERALGVWHEQPKL